MVIFFFGIGIAHFGKAIYYKDQSHMPKMIRPAINEACRMQWKKNYIIYEILIGLANCLLAVAFWGVFSIFCVILAMLCGVVGLNFWLVSNDKYLEQKARR